MEYMVRQNHDSTSVLILYKVIKRTVKSNDVSSGKYGNYYYGIDIWMQKKRNSSAFAS